MKLDLYIDVWPGMKTDMVFVHTASQMPSAKLPGNRRFKFTLEIPDEAVELPYVVAEEVE